MRIKGYAFSFCFFALLILPLSNTGLKNRNISKEMPTTYSLNTPLTQAHAHNDYQHSNPLIDALNYGFTSIEVDVYLLKGELYVSHNRPIFTNPNRTLSKMYLEPLLERYQSNGGQFYRNSTQPISLMIDIKNQKYQTYEVLKKVLEPFEEMLTSWQNHVACEKSVNIVLSGKCPIRKVMNESKRWVQVDGRVQDLEKNYPPSLMPTISGQYDEICEAPFLFRQCQHEKLANINAIAKKVAAEGKKFRLWKTPENKETWSALLDTGVNIINSDSLQLLSNFLTERSSQPLYSLGDQ